MSGGSQASNIKRRAVGEDRAGGSTGVREPGATCRHRPGSSSSSREEPLLHQRLSEDRISNPLKRKCSPSVNSPGFLPTWARCATAHALQSGNQDFGMGTRHPVHDEASGAFAPGSRSRHRLPRSWSSRRPVASMEDRACRRVIADPVRPGPTARAAQGRDRRGSWPAEAAGRGARPARCAARLGRRSRPAGGRGPGWPVRFQGATQCADKGLHGAHSSERGLRPQVLDQAGRGTIRRQATISRAGTVRCRGLHRGRVRPRGSRRPADGRGRVGRFSRGRADRQWESVRDDQWLIC